jgi:hypothetical protein
VEARAAEGATEPAGGAELESTVVGGNAVAVDPAQAASPIHRRPSTSGRRETGSIVDMAQVYRSNMNLT